MRKNSERVGRFIVAVTLLTLLTGCGNDPARNDENYEAAFTRYMDALSDKAYDELYDLLTPESKTVTPKETFMRRHNSIYGDIGAQSIRVEVTGVKPLEVSSGSGRLGGRRVSYHMSLDTVAGMIAFDNTADVYAYRQVEETVFLLDWDAHIIFPNLTAERPVRVKTQKASRGSVYDQNGVLLAGDGLIKSVGLVPGKMEEDRSEGIRRVAEVLGIEEAEIEEKLSAAWVKDDVFVPIYELAEEDIERKEKLLLIPGVRIDDKQGRVYPHGIEVSREAQYMDRLRGVDGCSVAITDARGNVIEVLAERPVVHGEDVYLDIDVLAD